MLEEFKDSPLGFSPFNIVIEEIALTLYMSLTNLDILLQNSQCEDLLAAKEFTCRALINLEIHNNTLCRNEG